MHLTKEKVVQLIKLRT